MAERQPALHVQIARDLFGCEWRDDWQAWCPPGWPPISVINPPFLDKLHALERHGGQPYGRSGSMDERGRPVIPSYEYDPNATEILWQWLYAQPGIQSVRFVPLPLPPTRWPPARGRATRRRSAWRCWPWAKDGTRHRHAGPPARPICRGGGCDTPARPGHSAIL